MLKQFFLAVLLVLTGSAVIIRFPTTTHSMPQKASAVQFQIKLHLSSQVAPPAVIWPTHTGNIKVGKFSPEAALGVMAREMGH